ncbi:MAG: hypothetical protein H8E12_10460 [Rhodobacteraceae bacterium]|nr:hypothetical protein [Paracoccaceae bacterium]
MDIEELLGFATTTEVLPADIAQEILSLGMAEFLNNGISYDAAIDLITKAQLSIAHRVDQSLSSADSDDVE